MTHRIGREVWLDLDRRVRTMMQRETAGVTPARITTAGKSKKAKKTGETGRDVREPVRGGAEWASDARAKATGTGTARGEAWTTGGRVV
ncbi:hypothetical protein TRAPUB_6132 [Trametes pubescens]|uniref:Uncharacterized protein n=1 Tax=Trametes pubescens TaxID=154538 RepID=A0A1M2V6R7_TRAPU|nr:hypothetical protein TRAPUB_6132 [Trametes pubescens]